MDKLVTKLPKLNSSHCGTCKECAPGKNTKASFHNSSRKTKNILELVHSDLCGPMSTSYKGGALYYVIFIDDFSRKTWIYFLKCKESEEILNRFKEFKALSENFSGKKLRPWELIMGQSTLQNYSKNIVLVQGLRGSSLYLWILNKTG